MRKRAALPTELAQMVVECIEDPHTLATLSLAFKSISPLGQAKLFRHVCVRGHDSLTEFAVFVEKTPHVASYIHSLHVIGSLHSHPQDLDFDALESLVIKLPQLKILLVFGYHNAIVQPGRQAPISRPSLRQLVLGDLERPSILRIMSVFNEIQQVTLSSVRDLTNDVYLSKAVPRIDSFVCEMSDSTVGLCESLVANGIAANLQHVDIIATYWDDVDAIAAILEACSQTIKSFTFDPVGVFECDAGDEDERGMLLAFCAYSAIDIFFTAAMNFLGLDRCRHLRSLVLYITLGDDEPWREPFDKPLCNSVIATLASAPRTLQELTFRLRLIESEPHLLTSDEGIDWVKLEHAISHLKDLTSITFEFEESFSADLFSSCRQNVENKMLRMHERGILRFCSRAIERSRGVRSLDFVAFETALCV